MSENITEKFTVKKSYGVGHLQPDEIIRLQAIVDAFQASGKKVSTGRELLFLLMDNFENPVNAGINSEDAEQLKADNVDLLAENAILSERITELAKIDVETLQLDNSRLKEELEAITETHNSYVKDIEGQDETFNEKSIVLKKDHPGTVSFLAFARYHLNGNLSYTDGSKPATEEDVLLQIMHFLPQSNINKKYLPK